MEQWSKCTETMQMETSGRSQQSHTCICRHVPEQAATIKLGLHVRAVPAAGALAAAPGAAGVCDEGVDGAAELADAEPPLTLTPLPLLKPSKLQEQKIWN